MEVIQYFIALYGKKPLICLLIRFKMKEKLKYMNRTELKFSKKIMKLWQISVTSQLSKTILSIELYLH